MGPQMLLLNGEHVAAHGTRPPPPCRELDAMRLRWALADALATHSRCACGHTARRLASTRDHCFGGRASALPRPALIAAALSEA